MMKKGDFLSEQERLLLEAKEAIRKDFEEKHKPKIKSTKVSTLVKVFTTVVLALTMVASTFAFIGCGNTVDPGPGPGPGPGPVDPVDPNPKDPPVVPVEKVQTLLSGLKDNYSYAVSDLSGNSMRYLIKGDSMKIIENEHRLGYYYYVEDGKSFNVKYNESDKNWHKTFADEEIDSDSLVYDSLQSAKWNSYDEEKKIFYGTMAGENIQLEINEDEAMIVGQTKEALIYNVGNTAVEMPENVIDDTIVPVENDYIFEVDKEGNYSFNVVLMKETLEKWMQDTDYYRSLYLGKNRSFEEFVYFNPTKSNCDFMGLVTVEGVKYFQNFKDNSGWVNFITNKTNNTKEKFLNYLDSTNEPFIYNGSGIAYEYSTLDYSAGQKTEFDTLTERVLTRISEKGIKKDSINNPYQDKIEEFSDAKVLFGFKTPAGNETAGFDLGYNKAWKQFYVLEIEGNIEFVEVTIRSSTSNGVANEKANVLNNTENWWTVTSVIRAELDKDNAKLFEEENVATQNVAARTNYFIKEKNKDLIL